MRAVLVLGAGLTAALSVAVAARPVTFAFPAETVPAVFAPDEAQVVVSSCSGCHSLDYIVTQPRHKGAQFWRDAVTKMINVYKAPIGPADADAVAAVLAQKLG